MRWLAGFLIVLLSIAGRAETAHSQSAPPLDAMWQAYQELDYTTATDSAEVALQHVEAYTPEELAQIHTLLALIAYSRNQLTEARGQFMSALSLHPNLELDPLLVSPKILDFFAEIRAERSRATAEPTAGEVRYVVLEDQRVEAALRSMLVPGWGQLHKGDRRKGIVLIGTWGAALGGVALTYAQRQQARQAYEDAATVDEALRRYDTYNRWYRTHNAVLIGVAGVWLYSYVDALLTGRPTASPAAFTVAPGLQPDAVVYARLRVHF